MVSEIEKRPENFADAEQFRNFHAKARFRATVATLGAAFVGSMVVAPMVGYRSGRALIMNQRMIVYPAMMGTWCVSYFVFNRLNGWTHEKRNKYLYAKNIRMLRNLQIRQ